MAEPRGYVIGVSPHKTGGWRIKYVEGGVQKTKYRKHEATAHKAAARLHLELQGALPDQAAQRAQQAAQAATGREEQDWVRVLWALTGRAVNNPHDRDAQALLRAVSNAANAAAKFIDDAKVRDEIAALEKQVALIKARRAADQEDHAGPDQARAAVTAAELLQ